MVRQLLLILGFCMAASSAAIITAAEPPARPASKGVFCQIRLLEGKPDGRPEAGTLQILAEPALTTLEGREARVEVGGRLNLPESKAELPFGTSLAITPSKVDKERVAAAISLEVSTPIKTEGETYIATRGDVLRVTGVFPYGKAAKIVAKDLGGGKQLWLVVTFETPPQVSLPPAGRYREVPSAQAGETKLRR